MLKYKSVISGYTPPRLRLAIILLAITTPLLWMGGNVAGVCWTEGRVLNEYELKQRMLTNIWKSTLSTQQQIQPNAAPVITNDLGAFIKEHQDCCELTEEPADIFGPPRTKHILLGLTRYVMKADFSYAIAIEYGLAMQKQPHFYRLDSCGSIGRLGLHF